MLHLQYQNKNMAKQHNYSTKITWQGNEGTGTSSYSAYNRNHSIEIMGKPSIAGSSDPAFRGDKSKHNPEDMLVSSLSACHMLWYLHLCAEAGVIVTNYIDDATGIMEETANGGGRFTEVTLNPSVTVANHEMATKANDLHKKANELCFIANSINFPVKHNPSVVF
jgi:organic hydroperoxide reductase OsmC/OhrA